MFTNIVANEPEHHPNHVSTGGIPETVLHENQGATLFIILEI